MGKIDAIRLGLAGGIVAAVMVFCITLLATASGFGRAILDMLIDVFPGYGIGIVGSLVGAGYSFVAGFIQLFALAFVYNMLGPTTEEEV